MIKKYIQTIEIPNEIIYKSKELLDKFIHCPENCKPSIRFSLYGNEFRIETVVCNLDNPNNRGCIFIDKCDCCKIKKADKYPGEDLKTL